jgi:hypothetical protein
MELAAKGRPRALDHFRARLFQSGFGAAGTNHWELEAGEQYRSSDAFEVTARGGQRLGVHRLHELRLGARGGHWSGSLGDVEPFGFGASALHRLRGLALRRTDPRQGRWLAFGGVPTPVPGLPAPRLLLGGLLVEDLRWDEAWLSARAFGFRRGPPPAALLAGSGADTLPGRGLGVALGWRVPLAHGWLGSTLGGQAHDLEGRRSLAVQHALEWSLRTRRLVIGLSDERATARARALGTDRLAPAARREQRWNLQACFARGRAESHFTGVVRDGGDPALAGHTVQLGASGGLGGSWYAGGEAAWDRRVLTRTADRRLSIHASGPLGAGHGLLVRLERGARGASPDDLGALAEALLALPRGTRWALAPRLGWRGRTLEQATVVSRLSSPLPWLSSRLTASLAWRALRDERFRGAVREAALALSLSPRLRDRGDVEVRRLEPGGSPLWQTTLAYDALLERYETPGGSWAAARDTGRVTVRVARAGNGSGLPDVLVSLDGTELRFTDADGVAHFDRVAPGIHVVAVEERSLPPHHEVVQASRAFVIVEPGRVPEPVTFVVARSERRTRF